MYDFLPIHKSKIIETYSLFKNSKIIKREHVTGDFLSEVLPHDLDVSKA